MNSNLQSFLQIIRDPVAAMVPGLRIDVSEPFHSTGVWIVNLFLEDYHLMIQFTEDRGFGLTAGDDDWGTSVDEVIPEAGAAVLRVWELLRAKGRTIPTTTLQGLRAEKSQREVAEAMDIKQPSYARMETEELSKLKLQTLQKIVAATKGKLHLLVETSHGQYFILNTNPEKSVGSKNVGDVGCEFSGSVPRHLVSLAPRREELYSCEGLVKDAYALSTKFHFGENVSLMWSGKCNSTVGGSVGSFVGRESFGGVAYSLCLFDGNNPSRGGKPEMRKADRELRLVK